MTIRTEDREQIRKQAHLTILGPREFLFQCDRCDWRRTFATESGAVTKGADHMLSVHRVKLTLKREQPLPPTMPGASVAEIQERPEIQASGRPRRVITPGLLGILAIAAMFGPPVLPPRRDEPPLKDPRK